MKAKPSVKKWRYTEFYNYDKLCELFAKDRATGEGAISAKEKVREWEKEESINQETAERFDEASFDNFDPIPPMDVPTQSNTQGTSSNRGLKRKSAMMETLDKHVEMLHEGINNVANAIREGNTIAEKGVTTLERSQPRIYAEEEIFQELLNIGVNEKTQLEAFLFLVKNQSFTRAFFAVPRTRRYEMLLKLMNSEK